MTSDVTRQKPESRFENLFDLIGDPVVEIEITDGEPLVRTANPAFEEVFGYDRERVQGSSLNEFIVPEECADEAETLDQRTAAGKHNTGVVTRQTATGKREFLYRGVPYERGGDQYGFAIYTDITERREHQRELQRQNERLEEFASIVTHDLRNPINVAESRIELLRHRYGIDNEHVDDIEASLQRMETIIDEVLTMARQGKTVEDTERVDLAVLSTEAWQSVDTGGVTLDVRTDRTVEGAQTRLLRLFENLFRNSVEHGSTSSRPQADDSVEHGSGGVTVTVGDTSGGFYVEDDGPGIPIDEQDRIFEKGVSTDSDGAGFGLAIVQTIVEAHGWEVTATESDDGGARFEIRGVTAQRERQQPLSND